MLLISFKLRLFHRMLLSRALIENRIGQYKFLNIFKNLKILCLGKMINFFLS